MHHIWHNHECDLGPRGSFLHRKTTNPKERIAKRKTKSGQRYYPSSLETEVVQVDKWKTVTAGLRKLQDNMQNVLFFTLLPSSQVPGMRKLPLARRVQRQ